MIHQAQTVGLPKFSRARAFASLITICLIVSAFVLPSLGWAQDDDEFAEPKIDLQSISQMSEAALTGMGYRIENMASGRGYRFNINVDGREATLSLQDEHMQVLVPLKLKVPLERVNEWNRRSTFGRAYLDTAGNAELVSELSLRGVTQAAITHFVFNFRRCVIYCVEHAGE